MRALWMLVVPACLFVTGARAASLRCGAELVSDGATRAEVVRKCGEPASKEVRTEVDSVRVADPTGRFPVIYDRSVVKTIEEWTYNFGSHQLQQVVTFENGKLRDVQSGTYGK